VITYRMQDVTLGYGTKEVVKDITFEAKSGELIGLVGPNGSGKSTIIKALSRIITPIKGEILLDGRNITAVSRKELAKLISVVPQIPVLPSAFTAFEIVLMGRSPHLGLFQYEGHEDLEIAWRAMKKTSTHKLAERKIGELSGGEIQSVVIARALTQETEAVLLDEPTANLDIGRQIDILGLFKSLCKKNGLMVIAALHDLNLAAHYCDRLVLIHNGKIHARGTPSEVITAENIRQVYGSGSFVHTHPVSGLPAVLPRVEDSQNGR